MVLNLLSDFRGEDQSQKGMASMIGKAKKLKREGYFPAEEFKELTVSSPLLADTTPCHLPIIVKWEVGKEIGFSEVDQLVDFLKKVA